MNPAREFDRFKIDWLFIRDLSPHPLVQRPFDEKWAQEIGETFDPDKFDPINVIPRGQKYLVFAGQHRLGGARIALGEDQRVPCHVHQDVPIEHLAEICLGVDHVKAWRIIDRWTLRIRAKQDVPVKIEAILHRHNLKVGKNAEEGSSVRAVAALETVYTKHGGEAGLDRTLKILGAAYGRDRDAYDGMLIRGAGFLVHRFDGQLDDESLGLKLSRHSGPGRMVGQARDHAKSDGISVYRAMADKMLKVYNTSRRTGKLEL